MEISPTNFLGKMPAGILVPSTEKSWEKLNLGGNQLYKFSSKKKRKENSWPLKVLSTLSWPLKVLSTRLASVLSSTVLEPIF